MRYYDYISEEESSIELLSELHEKVKSHPYRLGNNDDLFKDYQALLHDFSTVSLIEISRKAYKGIRFSDGIVA